jgi:hypothetical protein
MPSPADHGGDPAAARDQDTAASPGREAGRHGLTAPLRCGGPAGEPLHGSANPLAFMDLQGVQELSNLFERRVSAYQVGTIGDMSFDLDF